MPTVGSVAVAVITKDVTHAARRRKAAAILLNRLACGSTVVRQPAPKVPLRYASAALCFDSCTSLLRAKWFAGVPEVGKSFTELQAASTEVADLTSSFDALVLCRGASAAVWTVARHCDIMPNCGLKLLPKLLTSPHLVRLQSTRIWKLPSIAIQHHPHVAPDSIIIHYAYAAAHLENLDSMIIHYAYAAACLKIKLYVPTSQPVLPLRSCHWPVSSSGGQAELSVSVSFQILQPSRCVAHCACLLQSQDAQARLLAGRILEDLWLRHPLLHPQQPWGSRLHPLSTLVNHCLSQSAVCFHTDSCSWLNTSFRYNVQVNIIKSY